MTVTSAAPGAEPPGKPGVPELPPGALGEPALPPAAAAMLEPPPQPETSSNGKAEHAKREGHRISESRCAIVRRHDIKANPSESLEASNAAVRRLARQMAGLGGILFQARGLTDQTKGRCTIPSPTRARRRSP